MEERNAIRLVRGYTTTSRWQQRFMTHLNSFFNGVWLGVMDRTALDLIDEKYYESRNYVADEYNRRGLKDWESAAVEEHFPAAGRIVVTAAGAGREILALLERGFDAVGYEPNLQLARTGARLLEKEGHGGRLQPIDRDVFPPDAPPCDAVLVGWASYMLIPGRERRIAFLRAARERLPEGAPILLSFFARAPEERSFVTIALVANAVRRLLRRPQVEVGDALVPNFAHHFTQDEVTAELEAARFRVVFYEPEPYPRAVARAI